MAAVAALNPDAILPTHLHWDHFHGPSLRALGKHRKILVPFDRYDRMKRDLNRMGFQNVVELPHAKPYAIGNDLVVTPYLFAPIGDCAVVITGGGTTILNANDCKIVGGPLSQLLNAHPQIDFALRSHSPANSRLMYEYLDADDVAVDDRDAYLNSFTNFMAAVRPRYAIPFASNHCHLHRETLKFNASVVSPLSVRDYVEQQRSTRPQLSSTTLQVMLPGSHWHDRDGFTLTDTSIFDRREIALNQMAADAADALRRQYEVESRAVVSDADIQRYFSQIFANTPWLFRRKFKNCLVTIKAFSSELNADIATYWQIDFATRKAVAVDAATWLAATARITVPALVLRHAMRENMFGHISISKRITYQATTAAMPKLRLFELILCLHESELLPIRGLLSWRCIRAYQPRWRELLLYLRVAYLRYGRGMSFQAIEQHLLLEVNPQLQTAPCSLHIFGLIKR
jgi:UDP-MurNAc hydroxylase